jgi:hypothetical protein
MALGAPNLMPTYGPALDRALRETVADIVDIGTLHICKECISWREATRGRGLQRPLHEAHARQAGRQAQGCAACLPAVAKQPQRCTKGGPEREPALVGRAESRALINKSASDRGPPNHARIRWTAANESL